MKQYHELMRYVLDNGMDRGDRTGTGTKSVFGYQMRFDLRDGFPLLTTKKIPFNFIVHELLWFLKGDTNVGYLQDNGVSIWDEWADKDGNLGPIYGKQWVSWDVGDGKIVNQIERVIDLIKCDPDSRRLVVSAWNVADLGKMRLPPCHAFFQFYVSEGRLSCQLYQRSADIFLGVPFNIASYALLTSMIAHVCDLKVGEFVHTFGDAHIYNNHLEQVKAQLSRESYPLPEVKFSSKVKSIFDFGWEDIELIGYHCHSRIAGEVSVGPVEDIEVSGVG